LRHHGLPLDAVLMTGLAAAELGDLGLSRPAHWVPRLYAGFGAAVKGGIAVPSDFVRARWNTSLGSSAIPSARHWNRI
jgi:hypothetical protein